MAGFRLKDEYRHEILKLAEEEKEKPLSLATPDVPDEDSSVDGIADEALLEPTPKPTLTEQVTQPPEIVPPVAAEPVKPAIDPQDTWQVKLERDRLARENQELRERFYAAQNQRLYSEEYDSDEPISRREARDLVTQVRQEVQGVRQETVGSRVVRERETLAREVEHLATKYADFFEFVPKDVIEQGWRTFASDPERIGFNQAWGTGLERFYKQKNYDKIAAENAALKAQQAEQAAKAEKRREQNKQNLSKIPKSGGSFQEPREASDRKPRNFRELRPKILQMAGMQ